MDDLNYEYQVISDECYSSVMKFVRAHQQRRPKNKKNHVSFIISASYGSKKKVYARLEKLEGIRYFKELEQALECKCYDNLIEKLNSTFRRV